MAKAVVAVAKSKIFGDAMLADWIKAFSTMVLTVLTRKGTLVKAIAFQVPIDTALVMVRVRV